MRRAWMIAVILAGSVTAARADDKPFKIGVSVGLTGYAAATDRAWRDGLQVAADEINAHGGLSGRPIELVVEDNKSEPQEAVTVYRKMLSSDNVDMFISGCVSAGNAAAATFVVRAERPMVLCSILPPRPEHVKWAFSFLAPPRFEIETRYAYLKDKTSIRTVATLHDPSPYAKLQNDIAVKEGPDYGLAVPVAEQYNTDDADLSAQISKANAAGAKAILKMGLGGSTIVAAKNIKQLGQATLLLGSIDDLAVFKPAADALGKQFLFVAAPSQVYDALPAGPLKTELDRFIPLWRAKQGDRDTFWAGKAWDALMVTKAAVEKAKSFEGPKLRDALETISGFQGTGGVYNFSPSVHQGITENPFFMATMTDGKVTLQ